VKNKDNMKVDVDVSLNIEFIVGYFGKLRHILLPYASSKHSDETFFFIIMLR